MWSNIEALAERRVLYLTTIGRKSGRSREVEIWFVVCCGRFYLFAETGEAANWVRNIRQIPAVMVRIGELQSAAVARVLDPESDRGLWNQVASVARCKYGWGDGLPVEIAPSPQPSCVPGK